MPAYTYTSSASAAIHVGATVKFIDSQPDIRGVRRMSVYLLGMIVGLVADQC